MLNTENTQNQSLTLFLQRFLMKFSILIFQLPKNTSIPPVKAQHHEKSTPNSGPFAKGWQCGV